jgi:hypothetical protein
MGSIGHADWHDAPDRRWELAWLDGQISALLADHGVAFTFAGSQAGWAGQDKSCHTTVGCGLWPLYLRLRADRAIAAGRPSPPPFNLAECIFVCYFLGPAVVPGVRSHPDRDEAFVVAVDAFEGRRRGPPFPPGPRPHPCVWTPSRMMGLTHGDFPVAWKVNLG